jgi:hypothetical protein
MGIATRNEGAKSLCGCFSAAAFIVAARLVASLWRIEADQAVHRAIGAHGIAVDHLDCMRRDRSVPAAVLPRYNGQVTAKPNSQRRL